MDHEAEAVNPVVLRHLLIVIVVIGNMKSGRYQNDALKLVIPYLPAGMLAECQDVASQIESPLYRVAAITRIAQYAPSSVQIDILKLVLPMIQNMETNRAFAVVEYIASLLTRVNDPELISAVVEILGTITDASENVIAVTALLPALSTEASSSLAQTIIPLLPMIANDGTRASTAMKLAPFVSPMATALLLCTHLTSIDSNYLEEYWVPAFSGLPPEWKSFVLDYVLTNLSAFGYGISTALSAIVPVLPAELLLRTIGKALEVNTQEEIGVRLVALAAYIPDGLVQSVFDAALALSDADYQQTIICILAPRLSASQLMQALPVFCAGFYGYFDNAKTLATIAQYLPENTLPQFLSYLSSVDDLPSRTRIVGCLWGRFPANLLIEMIGNLPDLDRIKLLLALFPSLPNELLPEVVIASRGIADLASYFSEIGPRLDINTLPTAIKMADQLSSPLDQINALTALAPYAEPSHGVLIFNIARSITSPYDRVHALQGLAPYASPDWAPDWLNVLISAALEAKYHYDVGAPINPGEEIHMPQDIDSVLADILFECKSEYQSAVLGHLLNVIRQEGGEDEVTKASALLQIFACVPERALEANVNAAIVVVKVLKDDDWTRALESFSDELPTVFVQYALGAALRELMNDKPHVHAGRDRTDLALLGATLSELEDPMASPAREGPVGGGMLDVAGSLFNRNLMNSRRKLYRRGTASIPASLKLGEVFFLRAGVVLPERAGEEDLPIALTPMWPTKIQIRVVDPQNAFEFLGASLQNVEVSLDNDSSPAAFKLQPKAEGNCSLIAEFYGRGYLLDRVQVDTSVSVSEQTKSHNTASTTLIIPVSRRE